jgi:hypothetical protein
MINGNANSQDYKHAVPTVGSMVNCERERTWKEPANVKLEYKEDTCSEGTEENH